MRFVFRIYAIDNQPLPPQTIDSDVCLVLSLEPVKLGGREDQNVTISLPLQQLRSLVDAVDPPLPD